MFAKDFLQSGDCLLYRPTGFFGWVISVKTWHRISHCEGYIGNGRVVASRDGIGVNEYDLRLTDLAYILRPREPFDIQAAMRWFETVKGQSYDWWGLLRFFTIGRGKQDRMFCSELLTRWYRAGALEPFQPSEDADLVAPCTFLFSGLYQRLEVNREGKVTHRPGRQAGRCRVVRVGP